MCCKHSGGDTFSYIEFLSVINSRTAIRVLITSGFWPRVRARALRAPVILGSLTRQMGRCAPPLPPIAASLLPPNLKNIPKTKCFPSGPNSGRHRRISFHWTTKASKYNITRPSPHLLHPFKLRCTILSLVFTESYYVPRPPPRPSQLR